MAQVFEVQVLVAGDEFVTVDAEGVDQKVEEVLRHGTVVDKAADVAYLAFFYLLFQLSYEVGAAGGVVYQNVGVTGYFDAVARIDVVAGENKVEVRFDDVLGEHDVIVVSTGRKFDETGHFGVRLLHDEIERLPVGGVPVFLRIESDGKVEPVVSQKRDDFVFRYGHGLQVGEDFFPEKVLDKLLVKRFHVSVLVEDDVVFAQGGQYLFFVNAYTVVQLAVYFVVDFFHEFAGGLYGFFIALRCAGCHGLVVRHPDFVKLFQIGRVDGDEIDALV